MNPTIKTLDWVRKHRPYLDVAVRDYIVGKLKFLRFVPCFLHNLIARLVFQFVRLPVIVETKENIHPQSTTMRQLKKIGTHHYKYFPGSAIRRLKLRKLEQMIKQQIIRKVYLDSRVTTLLDKATPTVRSPQLWDKNLTGEGMGIAIVDTGIHPHPDLTEPTNRIIGFKDFVAGDTQPYDDNGHGTHCAGDAAGNGTASEGKYRGPAFEANLIGVKVLDKKGSGRLSDVIAGVEWCIQQREKYNISIISLSLGGPAGGGEDPLTRVVREAWNKGLVVVAAAGNEGPEPGTIGSPGIVPEIMTVGASDDQNTTDRGDDVVADFSSRGPTPEGVTKPDLISPGTNIVSLRVSGSFLDKVSANERVGEYYTSLSGTSMATPIVAGIVAQLLQQRSSLTPDEVKMALVQTAETLGEEPNVEGAGLIDALAASESLA